ncbi:MAG: hypothetical protein K0Q76_1379 [Panacagrimonas sp.]|jgi:hypothetical protein|nr:hypothetical protein [Panacagrimonas sp.]MCC2656271.1 hypothetical protein [Panacagrimonas sp.]
MNGQRVVPLLLLTLSACASQPKYGPSDDQALEPTRKSYQACLEKETRSLISGSDDVQFLTQHIVQQCDPALSPAASYLKGRGFDDWYIGRFLQEKRQHAMRATADFILRVKSLQNDGGGSSSPQPAPYF